MKRQVPPQQQPIETGTKAVQSNLKRARRTGQLNLIGLELKDFPLDIANFSNLTFDDNWWDLLPLSKLDLSNNEISQIDENIANEKDLSLIRMQNNKLQSLPSSIFTLQLLKQIDFTKNLIRELPFQLSQCQSLVDVNLSENRLEMLPPNMHWLCRLEVLNLSKNQLRAPPLFIEKSPLKRLDLSENKIEMIPADALVGCTQLEQLILSKNLIQAVAPGAFRTLSSLVNLFIDQNRLSELDELPLSEKLDQVVLSHNRLESFKQFSQFPGLTAFVASNNKLKFLDKSILKCTQLKTLDLTNNDLPDLPSEIGLLPKLVRLTVEGNPLKCIRNNIKNAGAEILKKYLRDRIPSENGASEIEQQIEGKNSVKNVDQVEVLLREFLRGSELIAVKQGLSNLNDERYFQIQKSLTVLDVSENKLSDLSLERFVVYAKTLQKLKAVNNQIKQLDNSLVMAFPGLVSIELSNNNLQDFFSNLAGQQSQLSKLSLLDLSVNKIVRISPIIAQGIPNLRVLNLAYNSISDVTPLYFANLDLLEVLDLSNNAISSITSEIAYTLPSLSSLNIENNGIQKLPTELGFMKLKAIQIGGNPLKLINRAIVDKGTVTIMDFLRNRHVGNPPTDLACMKPKVEIIDNPIPEPQANIIKNNDYQYRRQNHAYGQLNVQPIKPNRGINQEIDGFENYQQQQIYSQPQIFQQQRTYQGANLGNYQGNYQYNAPLGLPRGRNEYNMNGQLQQQYIPNQQYGGGLMNNQNQQNPYQYQQNNTQKQSQYQQGQGNQSRVELLEFENDSNSYNTRIQLATNVPSMNRAAIESEIFSLNAKIIKVGNEISDNYLLNKYQLNEKRKELQVMQLQRSRLQQALK